MVNKYYKQKRYQSLEDEAEWKLLLHHHDRATYFTSLSFRYIFPSITECDTLIPLFTNLKTLDITDLLSHDMFINLPCQLDTLKICVAHPRCVQMTPSCHTDITVF